MNMNCCRTCMSKTSLNPIFQYVDKSKRYTDILALSTGLKILINDSLPQVICTDCVNFINSHQAFRETCQRSHRALLKLINTVHLVENISIKSEIDSAALVKKEKNYFESNYDAYNDHIDSADETKYVNNKESIEFDMSLEDILKMNIDIAISKLRNAKKVKLKPKVTRNDVETVIKDMKDVDSAYTVERNVNKSRVENGDAEECRIDVKDSGVKGNNEELICKYCHKVYKSTLSLKVHYKTHTGRNTVCEHCGKKFVSKRKLLMHCKSKHGYEKTDQCKYCEYKGSNPYSVKVHERLHTGEKPYICQKCGATFHRCSSYLQHVAIHLPEKTVQCDQCPALFKSTTLMRIHKNRHRAPQYTFRCRVCDNSFARRRNVVRHFQRIHGMQAKEQDIDRVCRN